MTIDLLPDSPSGEISHNDVRLKVNETATVINDSGIDDVSVIAVMSEADFPAPVGGVITLADNTVYQPRGSMTISNRFATGVNSQIIGLSSSSSQLVYLGSDAFITSVNTRTYVRNCGLITTNPVSTLISHSGSEFCTFRGYFISCAGSFGSVNASNDVIFSSGYAIFNSNPFTITGVETQTYLEISDARIEQSSAQPCIDISGSLSQDLVFSENQFLPNGNGASIKADSGSSNVVSTAVVRDNDFNLAFGQTWLDGFSHKDEKWRFRSNEGEGVRKSIVLGSSILSNNTTPTSTGAGIPAFVGGIFAAGGSDQRMSVAATTGRLTNLAGVSIQAQISATGTLTNNSASTTKYTIQFYKNAVLIPEYRQDITVLAGSFATVALTADEEVGINQIVDIQVTTDIASSFIMNDIQFRVRDEL